MRIVMQPLFQQKRDLIKPTFFNPKTQAIDFNLLIVYVSELKIMVTSPWTFFLNYAYAVIYKQRLSHGNELEQLLHNYKCYGFNQNHFRKFLRSSTPNVKNNYRKMIRSLFLAVQYVTSLKFQENSHPSNSPPGKFPPPRKFPSRKFLPGIFSPILLIVFLHYFFT